MRNPKTNTGRRATFASSRSRSFILGPFLLIVVLSLGIFYFTWPSQNAGTQNTIPQKPSGTVTSNVPTTETWTIAKGLPTNITRLAFSASDPTRGYAAAFINKQTQIIYKTTDSGTNWQQSGTMQGPVGDYLSTNPLDAQDIVILSSYAPIPGTYTFQRSFDGGQTWSTQSTDLPTTGMVSQTGWSDSIFLVGFQLDGQLQGSSALVAFPKGQASVHLDVAGKINGKAIPHLHLITGHHNKVKVWGDDGSAAQNIIGIATNDLGKNWAPLPSTILGNALIPVAASDDGNTVLAASADRKQVAMSGDTGDNWASQPSFAGSQQANQDVLITANGKTFAIAQSDGTYAPHNGAWGKITSKQASYLSAGVPQHTARLWSQNDQGQIIWLDD